MGRIAPAGWWFLIGVLGFAGGFFTALTGWGAAPAIVWFFGGLTGYAYARLNRGI